MFCNQCQEALNCTGCTMNGVCGKKGDTSDLQDLLVYTVKGVCAVAEKTGAFNEEIVDFVFKGLFTTVTNVSFDDDAIIALIRRGVQLRDSLKGALACEMDVCTWQPGSYSELVEKAAVAGILAEADEDIRSLKELVINGIKGMSAYAEHAAVLGYHDEAVEKFMIKAMADTLEDLSADELVALALETGNQCVACMALLDKANTEMYGNPEITEVNLGVRSNPGILISGHDLKDIAELLEQTQGTGVDVYTHGEMLPAHYYPAFKKYENFVGNYGGAWWDQAKEFESFNGPIVMTTNCIVPPRESYRDRIYTTSVVGYPGLKHIANKADNSVKDFSAVIAQAKNSAAPVEIETGSIVGGFAHNQVLALADKVVEAVKSGAVRKFVVMAGCDGRQKGRGYYTEFAEKLPQDTIILTAGCAKYRYNKLPLGDIGGIPRVLDAGQCNDCYSLAVIALKLKEAFGLEDINDLPIVFNVAWYEQKAVTVLLALLALGVKNIKLGPTLPAFLSPNVAGILVNAFGISGIGDVDEDMAKMVG